MMIWNENVEIINEIIENNKIIKNDKEIRKWKK